MKGKGKGGGATEALPSAEAQYLTYLNLTSLNINRKLF